MEFSRLKPLVLLLGWPYCYSCENAKNLLEALWDPAVKFTCFGFNFFSFFNFVLAIIKGLHTVEIEKCKVMFEYHYKYVAFMVCADN